LSNDDWLFAARGLPVAMLAVVIGSTTAWLRARGDDDADRAALGLSLAVLALALLAKMALNVSTIHYGFALAMPATLVFVTVLVGWVPRAVARAGGAAWAARAVAIGVLAVGILTHLVIARSALAPLTATLGRGSDTIRGDRRAADLDAALAAIETRVAPEQTLVAVPEGIILNYLSRRASPLPYTQYGPFNTILWGEDPIRDAFERHPPDFVVITHVDYGGEGARFFGRDYARRWMQAIRERYRPVWHVGAVPFESEEFGVALWQRTEGGR
jgi:hypothetical protein